MFLGIKNRRGKCGESFQDAINYALETRLSGGDEGNNEGSLQVSSYQQIRNRGRKTARGQKQRGENRKSWKETVLEHWEMLNSSKPLPHKVVWIDMALRPILKKGARGLVLTQLMGAAQMLAL